MTSVIQRAPVMPRVAWWWLHNRTTLTSRDGFDVASKRAMFIRGAYSAPSCGQPTEG